MVEMGLAVDDRHRLAPSDSLPAWRSFRHEGRYPYRRACVEAPARRPKRVIHGERRRVLCRPIDDNRSDPFLTGATMLRSLTTECAHPSQRLLGDMGADVINVEPSGKGDRSRSAMDFRLKGNAFVVPRPIAIRSHQHTQSSLVLCIHHSFRDFQCNGNRLETGASNFLQQIPILDAKYWHGNLK